MANIFVLHLHDYQFCEYGEHLIFNRFSENIDDFENAKLRPCEFTLLTFWRQFKYCHQIYTKSPIKDMFTYNKQFLFRFKASLQK